MWGFEYLCGSLGEQDEACGGVEGDVEGDGVASDNATSICQDVEGVNEVMDDCSRCR